MGTKTNLDSEATVIRFVFLIVTMAAAAWAQNPNNLVTARDWSGGKLTLKLDDGSAEIEWISPVAFRVSRRWGGGAETLPKIAHEAISPTFEDAGQILSMRTRYLTLEVDRGDMGLRVKAGEAAVSNSSLVRTADGVIELRLNFTPNERVFGLRMSRGNTLNLRGQTFESAGGLFFTTGGYGVDVRPPGPHSYDLTTGVVRAPNVKSIEYTFYYGPTPKEIFEQHAMTIGADEVKSNALDLLTPEQVPRQAERIRTMGEASAAPLAVLVGRLIAASLTGVIYSATEVDGLNDPRAKDLFTMLPIVFRSSGESPPWGDIDVATRLKWRPYLITYLREAYDRGYPLIRPLPMQFSRDANSGKQSDVFMLGDEVLLAPMITSGNKRRLDLPRGNWTDLRTNAEYRGNQTIEVDAPAGRVPMFVRNGWIVPLEIQAKDMQSKMELHYFPALGGEFFLWEPDLGENSQFHAAPAGDYVRVEIETKVRRTYEWVLHHTGVPREVAEESGAYTKVARRELLQPGTWWHDAALNNLHLMVRAEAGTDRIVNMSF